jgi:hypothetical protein
MGTLEETMPHTVIRLLQLPLLAIALASPAARPAARVEDEINQAEEHRYAAMIAGDMDGAADLLADECPVPPNRERSVPT